MDKSAIKKYAIYARNKLIQSATDKALTIGISKDEIKDPDVKGDNYIIFTSSLGTKMTLTGDQIDARNNLIKEISNKGFDEVIEEVAYTWFNRLIAIRFMEVNDYLPSRLRVLSSDTVGKKESDLMSNPFDADLNLTDEDKQNIIAYNENNNLNEIFNLLFVKQCNKLNELLPGLFERTNEFTELLLDIRYDDPEDVVNKLVHDIPEDDFNVSKGGQVEIIGWLYQYYNTEPKDEVFKGLKKNKKITKENIPAATQLFTPDWIVRYMVENSLGRLWIEGHPDEELKSNWKYYLDEADQEPEAQRELNKIYEEHSHLIPKDIKVIDPAMGSGHILVYMFDVLMQIYESQGYSQRDAAELILENNLYGLDIDKRAYQLSYFSVMMKAREYSRRILEKGIRPHVYEIVESNNFDPEYLHYFGEHEDVGKKLISNFIDAKEYGSIIQPNLAKDDLSIIKATIDKAYEMSSLGSFNAQLFTESFLETIYPLYEQALIFEQKYDVVVTNPPYMGNMPVKMTSYIQKKYEDVKYDLYAVFIRRSIIFTKNNGMMALITQHTWMFISSFEKLRQSLMNKSYVTLLHLGTRAFEEIGGEVVQTVSFVLRNSFIKQEKVIADRLVEFGNAEEKKSKFLAGGNRYITHQNNFGLLPGNLIVYWLSDKFFYALKKKRFINDVVEKKAGVVTGNDKYFLRLWFEPAVSDISWKKCQPNEYAKYHIMSKGGSARRFYGNYEYVIKLRDLWNSSKTNASVRRGDADYYFKKAIGWSQVGNAQKTFRSVENSVCGTATPTIYLKDEKLYNYILAFLNTKIAYEYLVAYNPTINLLTTDICNLPLILHEELIPKLDAMVDECIEFEKADWDSFETSWDFQRHPFVRKVPTISEAFDLWKDECDSRFNQVKANEEEFNRIFINIYHLQDELTPEVEDKDVTIRKADLQRDIKFFISYAIGCMFGRYSLDVKGLTYAGGEWDTSKYYAFKADEDNIIPICDDEYFEDDIVGGFVDFVKTVYGKDTLEQNLEYIAKALGNKGETSREVIRNYFEKDFIKDHIKTYKKRPIYWLFNSGRQNGFKALIYMHRYDENTVSNVRTEYLHKVQDVYIKTIEDDQYTIDHSSSKSDVNKARKHIIKLQKQLDETKLYDMALAHIANERISIDLDDGVKVNYAKFQNVEIINDNGKKVKINLLEKI